LRDNRFTEPSLLAVGSFARTLITVVSLGLSSTIFAANLEEGQITGTIVEAAPLTIDTATKEHWFFNRDPGLESVKLKVGQKVTLHYYVTGRGKLIADKVEKAGKSDKARKKR
jgi:hypothetical protein